MATLSKQLDTAKPEVVPWLLIHKNQDISLPVQWVGFLSLATKETPINTR